MKKRLVKKWINRYIAPLVKDLPYYPNADYWRYENIVLINGERIKEGEGFLTEYNPKIAIRKQIEGLKRVLEQYKGQKIYVPLKPEPIIRSNQLYHMAPEDWRKHPKNKFYGVVMRLFVERR